MAPNRKTTTLRYFDRMKKKQQDQGHRYFLLFISEL